MTFRTTINSKGNPRDLIKRGLKSMFPNYETQTETDRSTPPVDTEKDSSTHDQR